MWLIRYFRMCLHGLQNPGTSYCASGEQAQASDPYPLAALTVPAVTPGPQGRRPLHRLLEARRQTPHGTLLAAAGTEPSVWPLTFYPVGISDVCHDRLDHCSLLLLLPITALEFPTHHLVAWPVRPMGEAGTPCADLEQGYRTSSGQ